jgi:hypothetical protein
LDGVFSNEYEIKHVEVKKGGRHKYTKVEAENERTNERHKR